MKRKNGIFLIIGCALLAFLFPLTACKHDNYFVLSDVKEGEVFEITLDAHGGTDYVWSYEIDKNAGVQYISQEFIPTDNNPEIMGGGEIVYQFKAVQAGTYNIRFECKIPHETSAPLEVNRYQITVV